MHRSGRADDSRRLFAVKTLSDERHETDHHEQQTCGALDYSKVYSSYERRANEHRQARHRCKRGRSPETHE